MFAKINLAFLIVVEDDKEITLFSREDEKQFTIQKSSPLYKTITRSKDEDLNEESKVNKIEICEIIDNIPKYQLFYAEFTKESEEGRCIHCSKVKTMADGRVMVYDLELNQYRTFYKSKVSFVSYNNKTFKVV